MAHDVGPVEAMIDAMQRQYGVADDKLRPAMEVLLRSTKDTAQAQDLLRLAMDVSAGTGKDLESVTSALAKAANGQTTALRRMVPELDENVLKSGNLNEITSALSATFAGQAQKSANTYEGQIKRLTVAFDELKESFGYGFLDALGSTNDATNDMMGSIKSLEPVVRSLGKNIGDNVRGLGYLVQGLNAGVTALDRFGKQLGFTDGIASKFFSLLLTSPLGIFAKGVDALTQQLNAGADAWAQYYAAAAGPSDFDISAFGGGSFGAPGRGGPVDRDLTFVPGLGYVNPQLGGTRGSVLGTDYGKAVVARLTGGGSSAKIKEAAKPIGIHIVDGMIEGIELGNLKLDQAGQSTLDKYVMGLNQAVQAKRDYASQIGRDMIDMLSLDEAMRVAEETGANIVDVFVEQSKKVAAFGANMITLLNAGLNETSWNQIYAMGAQNGAKIADALIQGNMAQNVARVNDAVGSVRNLGQQVGAAAADQFKQSGIESAWSMLENFMKEILPEGKKYKTLMAALDKLAADSRRTTTLTVNTVYSGGGGAPAAASSEWTEAMAAYTGPVFTAPVDFSQFGMGYTGFADGGYVPKTGMAMVHAKEFVLSKDMLSGRTPVPPEVKQAVNSAPGASIVVNAQTNADPYMIGREIAWNLKVGVM
jgi:hypothetical protein